MAWPGTTFARLDAASRQGRVVLLGIRRLGLAGRAFSLAKRRLQGLLSKVLPEAYGWDSCTERCLFVQQYVQS